MFGLFHKTTIKKTFAKGLYLFGLVLCSLILLSCEALKTKQNYSTQPYEKQLSDIEKKMDEVNHRVSVIQLMVGNHEMAIKDLDSSGEIKDTIELDLSEKDKGNDSLQGVEEKNKAEDIITSSITKQEKKTKDVEPAEVLYKKGREAYKRKEYEKSISLLSLLAENYTGHDLSDNALYWIGECHYASKNYSEAIIAFNKVVEKYPDGSKIPDAILKTGYAYISMGDKKNGHSYLQKVVKNYPSSYAASKAELMLKK